MSTRPSAPSEPTSEPARAPQGRSRRRGRLLPKLALAVGSVVVVVLLGELALSLAGYGNVEIYEPDPKLYWRLRPNQDCFTKVDHRPVHINSRGTRGPEFAVPKPAGTIRILALGDSRTFGWGLSESETYAMRLQELLQERVGGERRVEVINAGVNAWSYPQIKAFLEGDGLSFEPDFVLLGGANLWTQFSENSDPEFVRKMLSRVRLKNLLRRSAIYHFVIEVQLENFYQRYRTRFIPVDPKNDEMFKEAQKSDPDAVFRNAIEAICAVSREGGARPVVIFLPVLTDLEKGTEMNILRVKRDVCQRLDVPLIDFTADLRDDAPNLYLEADPVHLNARGNEIVARRLADVFEKLIRPEQPGREQASSAR